MKKPNNKYNIYKSLSRHESQVLNAAERHITFSLSIIQKLSGLKRTTIANTLISLKQKNMITLIKKNYYTITKYIPENIFALATTVNPPSYISFWTAASYYGLTEQQVKTIQVVSTKQHPAITFAGFRIETTTYQPYKFYGYQKVQNFAIAEKEKLIVDMLFKPELGGGVEEVAKCLTTVWPEINQTTLLEYLLKFRNKSCLARLGYLIERLKLKSRILAKIQKHLPRGFVKLNPARGKTNIYNKKWRMLVND